MTETINRSRGMTHEDQGRDHDRRTPGTPAPLPQTDAFSMARDIREGVLSPVAAVEQALARADAVQPVLNAFVTIRHEQARAAALEAENALHRLREQGLEPGPLHGVPIALKDMTPTRGDIWTEGSRIFADRVADHDATIATALRKAGAILIAKTTTPEFAWSGRTDSPLWGITRNPRDPSRTSGGSSGGSAVAVATGCVPLAEGSDMGGSIRIPASCCGVVGLKPSLGRIPYTGLPNAFDPLSHWGPLARTCRDAALFLDVTQGGVTADGAPRNGDPAYAPVWPVERFVEPLDRLDPRTLKVAVSPDLGCYEVAPFVATGLDATANALAGMGARVDRVALRWPADISPVWDREWAVWQAFYYGKAVTGREKELDPAVRRLIEYGRTVRAVEHRQGELMRTLMWTRLAPLLQRYDVLLCPTLAQDVPLAEGPLPPGGTGADGKLRETSMTGAFNLLGRLPVLSLPNGVAPSGLPTGVQVVGRPGGEVRVLQVGTLIEKTVPPLPPLVV